MLAEHKEKLRLQEEEAAKARALEEENAAKVRAFKEEIEAMNHALEEDMESNNPVPGEEVIGNNKEPHDAINVETSAEGQLGLSGASNDASGGVGGIDAEATNLAPEMSSSCNQSEVTSEGAVAAEDISGGLDGLEVGDPPVSRSVHRSGIDEEGTMVDPVDGSSLSLIDSAASNAPVVVDGVAGTPGDDTTSASEAVTTEVQEDRAAVNLCSAGASHGNARDVSSVGSADVDSGQIVDVSDGGGADHMPGNSMVSEEESTIMDLH